MDDLLPVRKTPAKLIAHLETIYSQRRNYCCHMEEVEKGFNVPYDPKIPVETYVIHLQEARMEAELL